MKLFKVKKKGIAERKTETSRKRNIPYKCVGLGILQWLIVTWIFFGQGVVRPAKLVEGNVSPATIQASVDFECENLSETEYTRNQAANAVPPIFQIDPAPQERAIKMVDIIFERIEEYSTTVTNQRPTVINILNQLLLGSNVDSIDLITEFPPHLIAETKSELASKITEVMSLGILSDETRITLFHDEPNRSLSLYRADETELNTIPQQEAFTPHNAIKQITESFEAHNQRDLLNRLLPLYVTDNLTYNESRTASARKAASENVAPVYQQYPAGTTLVRAGDHATAQILLLFKEHEKQHLAEQDLVEQTLEIIGNGMLLFVGLLASAVILRVSAPRIIRKPSNILLLVLLSLFTLSLTRLLTHLSVQYSLISPASLMFLAPIALSVLLTSVLLNSAAANALGFWCSFAIAVLLGSSFPVFALGILITITATCSARNIHRRSSLLRAGLWIAIVKIIYALIIAMLNRPIISVLLNQLGAAIISGILATLLTMLLIPLLEKAFKITTDITLLELSDMGHPLLQKMAMQAPGTYHHSLMVATLAQNAAEAIGANSLLIRVCAYYHDIGKMAKPEFFAENIQHKDNPHDELSPHMSALVISSHVKEGLSLAKRHKLPKPVQDAIEQHHGNGLISFFYHKAKMLAKEGANSSMAEIINDSDFRYGGAPAVSQEMSILSLADASEAAARSIEKPTPQKISNMMDDVFTMKIRDGQLDYAKLTMAEIITIKQSFIFSLTNMLHGRIPYPKDDHENKPHKPTDKTPASSK